MQGLLAHLVGKFVERFDLDDVHAAAVGSCDKVEVAGVNDDVMHRASRKPGEEGFPVVSAIEAHEDAHPGADVE
ncbi:MAG: hypothetical protein CNCCGFBP_01761 [Fimbriimonadaceae bacterium]|nr:hypothetical protein [Fimbriimonadaceae bacterium]